MHVEDDTTTTQLVMANGAIVASDLLVTNTPETKKEAGAPQTFVKRDTTTSAHCPYIGHGSIRGSHFQHHLVGTPIILQFAQSLRWLGMQCPYWDSQSWLTQPQQMSDRQMSPSVPGMLRLRWTVCRLGLLLYYKRLIN
jgi:hypothetical protein